MALYVAESYFHEVDHAGKRTKGVLGVGPGKESIYLHLVDVAPADIARLRARVDEDGNRQHDRLALPGNEEWWIAVEGEKAWPKTVRPRVVSRCDLAADGTPTPRSLRDDEQAELTRVGA